jgi:hypothetical protein
MTESYRPKARDKEIIIHETKDETLVYHQGRNKAFLLNSTIAEVWRHCNGLRDIEELSTSIFPNIGKTLDENLIKLSLDILQKEDLLEECSSTPDFFRGVSRREIIRKAGLCSMVALLVLLKLVAPTAAQAQSGAIGKCAAPGSISEPPCSNIGGSCTAAGSCYASGQSTLYCSVGGVCNDFTNGSPCFTPGAGTCVAA